MAHSKTHVVHSQDKSITVVSTITYDKKTEGSKTVENITTRSVTIDTKGR